MQSTELTSKADDQIQELKKINKQLELISRNQRNIGKFVVNNIHSIKKWVTFFGVLTIINLAIGFLIGLILAMN